MLLELQEFLEEDAGWQKFSQIRKKLDMWGTLI